jgi:sulfur carrier protein
MSEITNPSPIAVTVIVNGQSHEVKAGSTVADLLQEYTIAPVRVVVQLDGVIVQRSELDKALLQEGSKLEIVTLAGGG